MNIKYTLGAILSIPLLPILYRQGKRIKRTIPDLPEATGNTGLVDVNSKETLQLLTIGESTVAGVGAATHQEGFSGALASELSTALTTNINWNVYARSGYTALQIIEKILPKIKETKADLIVIGTGANDAFTGNRPRIWRRHIHTMIQNIRQKYPETPIAFMNMPPIKEFPAFTKTLKFTIGNLVEIFGSELNKVIQEYPNVFYNPEIITLQKWKNRYQVQGETSRFFSDGIHPSTITYQTWAKDFAQFVLDKKILSV